MKDLSSSSSLEPAASRHLILGSAERASPLEMSYTNRARFSSLRIVLANSRISEYSDVIICSLVSNKRQSILCFFINASILSIDLRHSSTGTSPTDLTRMGSFA